MKNLKTHCNLKYRYIIFVNESFFSLANMASKRQSESYFLNIESKMDRENLNNVGNIDNQIKMINQKNESSSPKLQVPHLEVVV